MEPYKYRLALIVGSTRVGRVGPIVARWFHERIEERDDVDYDVIDLAEIILPTELTGDGDAQAFAKRIDTADGVVVVTPEYNHGYPASLKTAIDTLWQEWQAKPIAFVSYGGVSGGLRAVEQLRAVFSELHAVTIRATVSFHLSDLLVDDGIVRDSERARSSAHQLLDQLRWWALGLRHARETAPYPT